MPLPGDFDLNADGVPSAIVEKVSVMSNMHVHIAY